ncbi:MAG: hypothetical protein EOO39_49040, partial [Cytophagaceae bacterium]
QWAWSELSTQLAGKRLAGKTLERLKGLIWPTQFNASQFSRRFYVVDEASRYQIEAFVASGRVKVHQVIPTGVTGHRILDCSF